MRRVWAVLLGLAVIARARKPNPVPWPERPHTLLLVIKGMHVGSAWLKELVELQAPTAHFIHEANMCVRTVDDIRRLLSWGTCEALNRVPSQLGCLSFGRGNFGKENMKDWAVVARELAEQPPVATRPRLIVASLIRTNAAKWAWSLYRKQELEQVNHMYTSSMQGAPTKAGARVRVNVSEFVRVMVDMVHRHRKVQQDAVALAKLLNATTAAHLTYERLQVDSLNMVKHLFEVAGEPFSAEAHSGGTGIVKAAPEDLSLAIENVDELRAHPSIASSCYQSMFVPIAKEMLPCDGGPPWLQY